MENRTTLDDWIKLQQTTGQLLPKASRVKGRKPTIHDLQAFEKFVSQTPFQTIHDLVRPFEHHFGYPASYRIIVRTLRRIGWTRKKRVFSTRKQTG